MELRNFLKVYLIAANEISTYVIPDNGRGLSVTN